MDNAFKALIMGAAVLLFVIGISTAVISYTRTMDAVDSMLTSSEQFNRTAESFTYGNNTNQRDTKRVIKGSEIIFQILNMKKASDYEFSTITVGGQVFNKDSVNEDAIKNINPNGTYEIASQNFDSKSISYRVQS